MAVTYRHATIKHLKDQQLRLTSAERRAELLGRAERLLDELEDERSYPWDYICFRITGFRVDAGRDDLGPILSGDDVRHDLRLFLEELAESVTLDPAKIAEPILTIEALSRRFNVSMRTITRWRRQGLTARRVLIDGRPKVGFLESSVERFVASHRKQVERGSRFRFLSNEERDEIILRARGMASADGAGAGLIEIARRIAQTMERSTETVRTTLRAYDREHPDRPIFSATAAPLDEETKALIYNQHRRGMGAEVLAKQHRRTRSSIYRIINEMRAKKILSVKLEYMLPHSEDFEAMAHSPAVRTAIVADYVGPPDAKAPRKPKPPKGLPPYLASLYENPLLSREEEMHLFRKMNFLKFLADKVRKALDPAHAKASDLDEIERLQEDALAVKNKIISANLRLVVSIAKRHVAPTNNFFDLVSDGNMSLIRAVEKFDYSRGNKFSTYASWAIMKNFARTIPEENYRRDHFITGHDEMFEAATDNRADEHECEVAQKRMEEDVKGMLNRLEPREQKIIIARYGINGAKEMTLEQLGRELGITKERVRQIEARAQDKLRKIVQEERLDLAV